MAAINTRFACPPDIWTRVTDDAGATGNISVMLANEVPVSLQATADTTAPTDAVGPLELLSYGNGWSDATIQEKFNGVENAIHLWIKPRMNSTGATAYVGISHG